MCACGTGHGVAVGAVAVEARCSGVVTFGMCSGVRGLTTISLTVGIIGQGLRVVTLCMRSGAGSISEHALSVGRCSRADLRSGGHPPIQKKETKIAY